MGTRFIHELKHLEARYDVVKEVRGRGLMIAMEFQGDDEHCSLSTVYRQLVERGFLVGYKPEARLLRFYPALTMGEENITQLVEIVNHILEFLR